MKHLGVIANLDKPGAADLLPELSRLARQEGLALLFDSPVAKVFPEVDARPCESFLADVDAVITLGGDGTLLSAVRRMADCPKPLLGVNLGKLGFLTGITQNQLPMALHALARNKMHTSSRPLLECIITGTEDSPRRHQVHALNDIVLSWGVSSHIAHLEVSVNGEEITTYTCDGLIVATPTGSTGHSLSAAGPVLHPDTHAVVISPICPHAMTVRPVVLPGDSEITIRLSPFSKHLVLACDGQPVEEELQPRHTVNIQPSSRSVELLHPPDYQYWQVLREKLHWRGSNLPHP